ncbi:MAG: DUF3344 domain-containing protein [Candidatus Eisenbacteria bacterium]|nr:DUF3344 domain-containing protein [Candidatus Latescibacterota bacterium]MBD3302122.1 DUF3344 domain-containing protein [Candidatus Eisenbacteria bacterium]
MNLGYCTRILLMALCTLLLPLLPAAAELDGRTQGGDSGDRTDSGQTVRLHLRGEDGTCIRVVTAGVRTRNADPSPPSASGVITLPAGPSEDNIIWAGLYWVILADLPPSIAVTLNGDPVTAEALSVTGSPCWPEEHAYPFFADVTALVVPGANAIDGLEDGGVLATSPESEGASLVVVYEDPETTACEILVTDGNDLLNAPGQIVDLPLPLTCGDDREATLTFIGADGQTGAHGSAPDDQIWNGAPLGNQDDWNASDPGASGAEPDLSWDTDPWPVVTGGGNLASVEIPLLGGPGDCVNWIATVIEVGVQQCQPVPAESSTWGQIKSRFR